MKVTLTPTAHPWRYQYIVGKPTVEIFVTSYLLDSEGTIYSTTTLPNLLGTPTFFGIKSYWDKIVNAVKKQDKRNPLNFAIDTTLAGGAELTIHYTDTNSVVIPVTALGVEEEFKAAHAIIVNGSLRDISPRELDLEAGQQIYSVSIDLLSPPVVEQETYYTTVKRMSFLQDATGQRYLVRKLDPVQGSLEALGLSAILTKGSVLVEEVAQANDLAQEVLRLKNEREEATRLAEQEIVDSIRAGLL